MGRGSAPAVDHARRRRLSFSGRFETRVRPVGRRVRPSGMDALGLRLGALAAIAASLALAAGATWDRTPPEEWTRQQVDALLTDSPWAKAAEVRFLGEREGSGVPGIGLPGRRGRTGGGSRIPGGGGWPGAGGGIGCPWTNHARDAEDDVTVVWTSALPVRQALQQLDIGDERRDVHARYFYIVTIDGLPLEMAPLAETSAVFLSAALERKGAAAIRAERVEVRPRPGAPAVELYFPRGGLAIGDKTVEFALTAGEYSIRRKFKLGDMVYRGRLEM